MPYLGQVPLTGNYNKLDNLSGSFNSSTTAFNLTASSVAMEPVVPEALLVSINGVVQEPHTDYTISGSAITFTTAPASTDDCFIVILGAETGIGTPSDATVTSAKLTGNLVTPGTLDVNGQELILDADADTSITADSDDQIDIKIAGADDFQLTANTMSVLSGSTLNIDSGATIANSGTATGFGQAEHANLTDVAAITQVDGDIIMSDGTDYKAVPRRARNLIINGDLRVVQRGTSETNVFGSAGAYLDVCDRYKHERQSGFEPGEMTVTQDTSVPSGKGFGFSMKFDVTTNDASIAANDGYAFTQPIEAQNLQHLEYGNAAAKAMVLSFWFRASLAQTFCVSVDQPDGSRRMGIPFTVASPDTWEHFVLAIPGDTSGTINNDTGAGLLIRWMMTAGSTYQGGTASTWGATNNNQLGIDMGSTNLFATTDEDCYITGIQLEVGSIDTPFEHLTYGDELRACERYYERLNYNAGGEVIAYGAALSTSLVDVKIFYTRKRVDPTITFTAAATFDAYTEAASNSNGTVVAVDAAGETSASIRVTGTGTPFTAGDVGRISQDGSDTCYIEMNSEL